MTMSESDTDYHELLIVRHKSFIAAGEGLVLLAIGHGGGCCDGLVKIRVVPPPRRLAGQLV